MYVSVILVSPSLEKLKNKSEINKSTQMMDLTQAGNRILSNALQAGIVGTYTDYFIMKDFFGSASGKRAAALTASYFLVKSALTMINYYKQKNA